MEKKGTLGQKRRPKGDPNPQKGPLGDPGPLKGTHLGTVKLNTSWRQHCKTDGWVKYLSHGWVKSLCPSGSPLGDPGPLGDLFVDLGPL